MIAGNYRPEARIFSLTKFGMIDKIKIQKLTWQTKTEWLALKKESGLEKNFQALCVSIHIIRSTPNPGLKIKNKTLFET